MIVRVSARGQANGSADGYICAREQQEQAEGPRCAMRAHRAKRRLCEYHVLPGFNFGNMWTKDSREIFIGRARRIACRRGVLWGSKPRLARSRLPRYMVAMERKPCSSRFVRSRWLGGLVGVTLGSEHNHT